jgi:hypothetical protein
MSRYRVFLGRCRFNLGLALSEDAIQVVSKETDRTVAEVCVGTRYSRCLCCCWRQPHCPPSPAPPTFKLACGDSFCSPATVLLCSILPPPHGQVQLAVDYLEQATRLFSWLQIAAPASRESLGAALSPGNLANILAVAEVGWPGHRYPRALLPYACALMPVPVNALHGRLHLADFVLTWGAVWPPTPPPTPLTHKRLVPPPPPLSLFLVFIHLRHAPRVCVFLPHPSLLLSRRTTKQPRTCTWTRPAPCRGSGRRRSGSCVWPWRR